MSFIGVSGFFTSWAILVAISFHKATFWASTTSVTSLNNINTWFSSPKTILDKLKKKILLPLLSDKSKFSIISSCSPAIKSFTLVKTILSKAARLSPIKISALIFDFNIWKSFETSIIDESTFLNIASIYILSLEICSNISDKTIFLE